MPSAAGKRGPKAVGRDKTDFLTLKKKNILNYQLNY
jgi:hypothetical protein